MKCGIDLVQVDRIEDLVARRGSEYLSRIWSQQEIIDCTQKDGYFKFDSLAARYAAKEAVSKALGTGFGRMGVRIDEIEVHVDVYGSPFVLLHGTTKEYFEKQKFKEISISLSHEKDLSIAMCVIIWLTKGKWVEVRSI